MTWPIILAVGVAIGIIVIPVAFVWYLNIRGTYQVVHDARERQRRRAEVLKEAEALIRDTAPVAEETTTEFWMNKVPCWEMNRCPTEIRDECPAYRNRVIPCWAIEGTFGKLRIEGGKACGRDTTVCQTCPVYKKYGKGKPIHIKLVGAGTDTYLRTSREETAVAVK
jgi:hypothetical protein